MCDLQSEPQLPFRVGDLVEAFGLEGHVIKIDNDPKQPILVDFEKAYGIWFCADGKAEPWHREPSLKLVSRPKKKITKTIERWKNVYPGDRSTPYHESEEDAYTWRMSDCIATVKLTGSYEVEE